jgi:DNA-binding HxlR family transcriptional regulator
MKRKSFENMQCPIARTLERVGDWWSLLIIREAMFGVTRFDDFRANLGISSNILSGRLKQLVESGVMERRVQPGPPVRVEYGLTEEGRAFQPVLLFLNAFGNRLYAPEGEAASVVHRETGRAADVRLIDVNSGLEVMWPEFHLVPGPAANHLMTRKLNAVNQRLAMLPKNRRARGEQRTHTRLPNASKQRKR